MNFMVCYCRRVHATENKFNHLENYNKVGWQLHVFFSLEIHKHIHTCAAWNVAWVICMKRHVFKHLIKARIHTLVRIKFMQIIFIFSVIIHILLSLTTLTMTTTSTMMMMIAQNAVNCAELCDEWTDWDCIDDLFIAGWWIYF